MRTRRPYAAGTLSHSKATGPDLQYLRRPRCSRQARALIALLVGSAAGLLPVAGQAQSDGERASSYRAPSDRAFANQAVTGWAPSAWPKLRGGESVASQSDAAADGGASTVRDLLQLAERDLASGRTDAAIDRLERLAREFPETAEAKTAKDRLLTYYRNLHRHGQPAATPDSAPQPPVAAPAAPSALPRATPRARKGGDDFKSAVGDRIFFGPGDTRIDARQRTVLQAQADWLKAHPETIVRLAGYAADPGPRDLNDLVSLQRAEAVREILVQEGVSSERIEIRAFGNSEPIARCGPELTALPVEPCASQNRRVVSEIVWTNGDLLRRRLSNNAVAPGGDPQPPPVTPARSSQR